MDAVSHVAPHQEAAEALKAHGYTATADKYGNIGFNTDALYDAEMDAVIDVKEKHKLMIRIKRSGTGLRVTLGTKDGFEALSRAMLN